MTTASGGKIASKADFLTVIFDTVDINVPKLGRLTIKEFSANERLVYDKELLKSSALGERVKAEGGSRDEEAEILNMLESKVIAMHLVNDKGEYMFDPDNDDDIAILRKLPDSIHKYIFNECMYLSKLRDRPKEEGGEPEVPLALLTSSTTD